MTPYYKGLYRSSNQAVIGGVAAGIAEHLNTDPTIIRIIFAILALFGGGVLVYLILWIALPAFETSHYEAGRIYTDSGMNPTQASSKQSKQERTHDQAQEPFNSAYQANRHQKYSENGSLIAGLFMIAIGLMFLANSFLFIGFRHLWPILLLIVGILLIKSAYNRNDSSNTVNDNDNSSNPKDNQ